MRRSSLATALLLLVQTDASCMIGSGCMSRSPKATSSSMMLLRLVRPFAPPYERARAHAKPLVLRLHCTPGTGARGYVIQARCFLRVLHRRRSVHPRRCLRSLAQLPLQLRQQPVVHDHAYEPGCWPAPERDRRLQHRERLRQADCERRDVRRDDRAQRRGTGQRLHLVVGCEQPAQRMGGLRCSALASPHHERRHVRCRHGDNQPRRLLGGDRLRECSHWDGRIWDGELSVLLISSQGVLLLLLL